MSGAEANREDRLPDASLILGDGLMPSVISSFDGVRIIQGDSLVVLKSMEDDSVDCIVTSPAYWGLRDYGVDGQMGMEPTIEEHIDALRVVMRECYRVLKPAGIMFMNYGDCYATNVNGRSALETNRNSLDDRSFADKPFATIQGIWKNKDRILLGPMVAMALVEDGWALNDQIIWHKPNPMPDSAYDRCTPAYEYVYQFSKPKRGIWYRDRETGNVVRDPDLTETVLGMRKGKPCQVNRWRVMDKYFDADEIKTEPAPSSKARYAQDIDNQAGSDRANAGRKTNGPMKAVGGPRQSSVGSRDEGANRRNVWTIPTMSFKQAHFATFPPELAEMCIKAACPPDGIVLDPFGGAGTTGLVANRLQRKAILIELNAESCEIAMRRLRNDLCRVSGVDDPPAEDAGPLFGGEETGEFDEGVAE